MASELASLPIAVLDNVQTFTGNTYANSNFIDGISNTSAIQTGMVLSGTGIAPNTQVVFVSTNSIQTSIASTASGTGISLSAGFESYVASTIYSAVPQFMQDSDATTKLNGNSNTYILYRFIKAMSAMIDEQVGKVARYGIGASGYRSDAYALAPNWSNLLDINRCPDWALPWLAQFVGVTFTNADTLTYAQKVDKIKNRSSYVRGTAATIQNAITAEINARFGGQPGFVPITMNQVLIMEQTMPYTVSFLGNTSSSSTPTNITNANISGLVNGMYLYGTGIPAGTTISSTSGSTVVMSNSATVTTTSSLIKAVSRSQFVPDQYSMVILVPNIYFFNYTYSTLNKSLTGSDTPTYLTLDTAIGVYSNLSIDPVPKSNSALSSFIYKYRPAGVQVYIGGY